MTTKKHEVDEKIIVAAIADSNDIRAEINRQAQRIAAAANASLTKRQSYPDYDAGQHTHSDGMPGATVYTRSNHAKYSNAKHNTLVKALSGGSGSHSSSKTKRRRRRRRRQ